jgi:sulfur-oxidizing protein SoxY
MMRIARRNFLKTTLVGSGIVWGASLFPRWLLAETASTSLPSASPEEQEAAKQLFDKTVNEVYGKTEYEISDKVVVKSPDHPENGSAVNVEVSADLPEVTSITLIAANNPAPMLAKFKLSDGMESYVYTRVKLAKTGNISAVVESAGKLYVAHKEVIITVGGCGA